MTEGASTTDTTNTLPRARNDETQRPSLGQVLDLAIDEKNAVNFIFLKKWVYNFNQDSSERRRPRRPVSLSLSFLFL